MVTLYQIDNNGKLRVWNIEVQGYTIIINHGQQGGAMQQVEEPILAGKGSRSIDEQIESRVNSRINKQLDRGYRYTIAEAKEFVRANKLNLHKPMLAQQFNKQKKIDTAGAILQRKLDGNRMLATRNNGSIVCYTRNGKPVETLDHIVEQLDWIEEGQTIDGEVYLHGMALKDINSRIRKKQSGTVDLNYHIYDIIDDRPFTKRFLTSKIKDVDHKNIVIEPLWPVVSKDNTEALFNTVRSQGYEGLMMRLDNCGYEPGKRSKSLLKIKFRYDAEYEVIDVELAKNGAGILVMRLPNGDTVKGVAPGTMNEKLYVAENPEAYIGKRCTCSFSYLTDYGIPFHLTCDRWL